VYIVHLVALNSFELYP